MLVIKIPRNILKIDKLFIILIRIKAKIIKLVQRDEENTLIIVRKPAQGEVKHRFVN